MLSSLPLNRRDPSPRLILLALYSAQVERPGLPPSSTQQQRQQQQRLKSSKVQLNDERLHCHRNPSEISYSSQQLVTVGSQLATALARYPALFEHSLARKNELWKQLHREESMYNKALTRFIRQEFHALQAQLEELCSHQHDVIVLKPSETDRLKAADKSSHACLTSARQQLARTQAELQCLDSLDRNLDSLPWRPGQEEVCQ